MLKQSETYSYEDNAKFKKILENVGYIVFCIYKELKDAKKVQKQTMKISGMCTYL